MTTLALLMTPTDGTNVEMSNSPCTVEFQLPLSQASTRTMGPHTRASPSPSPSPSHFPFSHFVLNFLLSLFQFGLQLLLKPSLRLSASLLSFFKAQERLQNLSSSPFQGALPSRRSNTSNKAQGTHSSSKAQHGTPPGTQTLGGHRNCG